MVVIENEIRGLDSAAKIEKNCCIGNEARIFHWNLSFTKRNKGKPWCTVGKGMKFCCSSWVIIVSQGWKVLNNKPLGVV